ncbi:MAG: PLP-dependent aminotransferase family protein [Terriglobia bacterium]|jgi:GntR family transcriptional regulator/MocR family aminotransferase|nr:PLP-dependent aminotransferase family protein [Terriglobia bacterium]
MKKVAKSLCPVVAIDHADARPLHRQIYDGFRVAILRSNLSAGQQVPSSRQLASELGISRIPVLTAYSQLLAEDYFETRTGSGTFVSASLAHRSIATVQPANGNGHHPETRSVSRQALAAQQLYAGPWPFGWGAFGVGQVALDHFPFATWSRLLARHSQRVHARALHYSDPKGSPEFRNEIATYLRTARALNCDAEQVVIVSGTQQALEITARVLADPGDHVWMEEPGYWSIRRVLSMNGCCLVPVPVDDEGINVAAGIRACRKARAAFVTPSHQFPLGATMSAARRIQLLEWAEETGAWIVEDDYDSEYRYEAMPIASLQGLDRNSRVIYIGTFSKTLFPSLRVGYLVVPRDLVSRFIAVRVASDLYPPHLYQAALADFMAQGHFARHIRRTRQLYRERRSALVDALRQEFGPSLEILGAEAGLHVVIKLPHGVNDVQLSARAVQQKLWLWPLSCTYIGPPAQGVILGFGSTPTREIPNAVRKLRELICEASRSTA